MIPRSKKEHYANVAKLRCVVTGSSSVTLHHCHGGSMRERLMSLGMDATKGLGRRGYGDALIIPLVIEYHSLGPLAIDGQIGVVEWERRFGSQTSHLDQVGQLLGYSLWDLHASWCAERPSRIFKRPSLNG